MHGLELIDTHQWSMGSLFGVDHSFLYINAHTIITTWIVLLLLFLILAPIPWLIKRNELARHAIVSFIDYFRTLIMQSIAHPTILQLNFIITGFIFVLACNISGIVPGLEKEPTADINTTVAFSLLIFFYAQASGIHANGLWEYIKSYFSPFFIMLPLNIIGRLSSILSLSLRLFGNIFGGSIISGIYFSAIKGSLFLELLGVFSGVNLLVMLFFNVFEGFLQAFVFAMLSLTYISLAIEGEH